MTDFEPTEPPPAPVLTPLVWRGPDAAGNCHFPVDVEGVTTGEWIALPYEMLVSAALFAARTGRDPGAVLSWAVSEMVRAGMDAREQQQRIDRVFRRLVGGSSEPTG